MPLVETSWGRSNSNRPVRIQRDYFSRMEEVRRELRAIDLHHEDTFIGTLERLDGVMNDDGRRSVDVVLLALLLPDEGETVRAKTALSAEDYAKADRAHMTNGTYVQVTGRLLPGRQPRQLMSVSRFDLISPVIASQNGCSLLQSLARKWRVKCK